MHPTRFPLPAAQNVATTALTLRVFTLIVAFLLSGAAYAVTVAVSSSDSSAWARSDGGTGATMPTGGPAIWNATFTRSIPSNATNISFTLDSFLADDKGVLKLNGVTIADAVVQRPNGAAVGAGTFDFGLGAGNQAYNFVGFTPGTVFSLANGTTTLTLLVYMNDTSTTDPSAPPLDATFLSSFSLTGSLNYDLPPQVPSLNKAFSPSTINAGATTTLTFTVTNPAGVVAPEAVISRRTVPTGPGTGNPAQVVSFTDTLPSGLKIAAAPNVGGTCTGGTVSAVAGTNIITVTGKTVPASGATAATCTVSVDVTNVTGQLNASCTNNPAAFTNAGLVNTTGVNNISGLSNLTNAVTQSCVVVNGQTFSISKVASASSLLPNSPLTYTITVTNNGPSGANGSVLTDPVIAGFAASGISCTNATNLAACPAPTNVTLANLQGAGIVLPTFPANSAITFQLSGTFTQQIGNAVNTATVTSPAGLPLQTQSAAATVTVQIAAPATIPTISEQVLLALMLLLAVAGATCIRRVRR